MNHSKLFTVISKLFTTSKTKKKSIAISSMQQARQVILSIFCLLFFSATAALASTYNVGLLDITTNGGTGFGNATPGSATGYTTYSAGGVQLGANASAVQPDGKIVVVGSWNVTVGDPSYEDGYILRYNINGTLDATWHGGVGYPITISGYSNIVATGVAIQADGKIVVVGNCVTTTGSYPSAFVARYLPNGTLDTATFGGGTGFFIEAGSNNDGEFSTDYYINAVAIQPSDQKIVVAGQLINDGTSYISVARIDTAGVSSSFNNNLHPGVTTNIGNGVAIASDGKILVVGQSDNNMIVARYTTNLDLDTTGFNASGTQGYNLLQVWLTSNATVAYAVGFQKQGYNAGKIVVAGGYTPSGQAFVARFTTDGLLDTTAPNGFGFTFDSGATYLGYTSNGFGVSAAAKGCVIQNDDKIVISGYNLDVSENTNFLIAQWLADGSDLDPDFANRQGDCTTNISNPNYGHSLSLQQNGSFIVAGTIGSGDTQTATARYLGNQGVQGCMDISYNPAIAVSPGTPGFCINPTNQTLTNFPRVVAVAPASDNSVFVLSSTSSGSNLTQLVQLNSAGAVIAGPLQIAQSNPKDLIIDTSGRLLVCGQTSGNVGWIARYTVTPGNPGTLAPDSTFNTNGSVLVNSGFYGFQRIGLLNDGQIVVIGKLSNNVSAAYAVYNPHGTNSPTPVTLASGTPTDLLVSSTNVIYVAVQVTDSTIYLYNSNGVSRDTGYTVSGYGAPSIAFDNSGNIIVGVIATNGTIRIIQYAQNLNPLSPSGTISQTTSLLSNPKLTRLQCDTNNRPICTGYDDNSFFVGRLGLSGSTYSLDTTFAPYATVPGILKTTYNDNNPTDSTTPKRVSNSVAISPNGSILFGGYENINSSSSVSLVGKVVGATGVGQNARFPAQSLVGTIDTNFGTNGSGTLEVPGGLTIHPESMHILSNGDIILGINHSTISNLAGLTSAFALDTTDFGVVSGDSSTPGITADLPVELVNIRQIITDHAGDLYVVGDNGTQASVVKLTADGSAIKWHTETLGLSAANCVVEQASGRILVSGYISPYGVIVAYDPNTGAVDTSFNQGSVNPGYYKMIYNNQVTSLSIIDDTDKILFTYANYYTGPTHQVQLNRLLENGAFDTDLTLIGTPINSFTYNNTIKMQQDVNNKIVVVASVGDGFMASRYNADGSNNVINTHILVDAVHVGSSSLKNILCLSDGTTLILGTNSYSGSTYLVLAKLKSDFTLDTTFNPAGTVPGVLNTVVTSPVTMTNFYALGMSTVSPYDILVAGDDGTNPYLIGVVSGLSSAVTPTNQSTRSWGLPGTLDTTYNAGHNDSHEAGFFDLGNEINPGFAGESVQAMLQNSDGSYFVVSSWITSGYDPNSYVMKFNSDDTKNTTFGAGTFITISGMATAHDMIMMQDGNLLIVGETIQNYCRIVCLNQSTGEVVGLFDISWGQFFYNNAVAQQSNGRLIISGAWLEEDGTTKTPALLALNPLTFEMDFTFGDGGIYRYPALSITTPQGIGNMVIDDNGDIYFIIQYSDSGNPVGVYKLSNTGVGPVLWTGNQGISSLGDSRYNQIARDQNGNIVVASSGDSSTQFINVYRFDSNDGNILQTNSFAYATTGITYPLVSGLMIDQTSPTGNIILCGHNGTSPDNPFVMRVLSDLSAVDTTFNAAPAAKAGVQPITVTAPVSSGGSWGAGFISTNGKITVGGYAIFSSSNKPYLMRLYGNDFIGEYSQSVAAGVPGTLNLGFGTNGYFRLSDITTDNTVNPVVVLPLADGYQYIAFNDGTLVRLMNNNELDETYGPSQDGFATDAPAGVTSMIMDANGCLVLVGTAGNYGWIVRYAAGDSGQYDETFNEGSVFYFEEDSITTCVVEQTLSRLVVGGQRTDISGTNGILWALTNTGAIDVTFNANNTPGNYVNNGLGLISSLVADEYDRLIFTCNGIDRDEIKVYLVRITASGEYDTSTQISAFDSNYDATQIRVCFDVDGNIVVAAITDSGISVIAYDSDFHVVENVLTITSLANPTLSDLIASADGKILMSGRYNDGDFGGTWVARVQDDGDDAYELDVAFNPTDSTYGTIRGIMQLGGPIGITSIAIYGDGELTIGAGALFGPYLLRAYNNPYTSQEAICQYALPVGTNDQTFGVTTNVTNGITFFATQDGTDFQAAQAIALQDDQNILVAINSQYGESPSIIVLNMFDVDGLLNTSFNSSAQSPCNPGQAIVLDVFDNQYVQDMMTFTTVDGVHKAILAGYATNNTLQASNSLLIQFDLHSAVIDEDVFGGFNGDPQGVAMGNGPSQAFTLGRQSMGRIIVGGVSPSINNPSFGLLQAYTASGLLDQSFGQAGYFTQGITGIYSAVIDSQDRVVCLYGDGSGGMILARILADGSGLDTTFNPGGGNPGWYEIDTLPGTVPTNNCKVALDSSGNIFVVAATIENGQTYPTDIVFIQFDHNGIFGSQIPFTGNSSFGGLTNFTITQLLITATQDSGDDNIIIVGYDQAIAGNQIMVVSIVQGGDFGWKLNEEGFNAEETSGYIKYAVGNSSLQTSAGAIIHPDGRVIIAGSVDNNIPG